MPIDSSSTMRRSPLGSAFAAALLVWFALVSAEPAFLHSCPVHGGASSTHAAAEPATHGDHDSGTAAHSAHASRGAPSAHESSSHDEAPEQHRCACIGDCSSGPAIAGLPAGSTAVIASADWIVRASIARDDSPLVTAPAFLRPYANGPPSGHVIA